MSRSTVFVFAFMAVAGYAADETQERLTSASTVLKEMMDAPDKGIPRDLFSSSVCAVVIPSVKKAGFIVGGKYGRGFASCKLKSGAWSGPSGVRIEGGSFGLQAGGAESDVILLVRNESGMQKLLKSKFTIGGEASAAAGPVGREASAMTDAMLHAEILSWSRSRGVFGGVSLNGSTMRNDEDADKDLYKMKVQAADILTGKVPAPAAAMMFLDLLQKYSAPVKG